MIPKGARERVLSPYRTHGRRNNSFMMSKFYSTGIVNELLRKWKGITDRETLWYFKTEVIPDLPYISQLKIRI